MSALIIRSRRHIEPADDRRRNGPVVSVRPDPAVWRAALREAGGDITRLQVQADGSVIVCNRQPPQRLAL